MAVLICVEFSHSDAGAQSGDIHVLSFDDPKLSDTDYANIAWKLASS